MAFTFSKRSIDNLKGVHPDLVKVAYRALELTERDFIVIEGLRSVERQKQLVKEKKSKTMNSRHLTGHAIDVVPSPVEWSTEAYAPVLAAFRQASKELGINIELGVDWKSFPDSPHIQLSHKEYPK